MREKSRERGKGSSFGSGGGFSGFSSRISDRSSRVFETRGRKICLSSSDRFKDAAFRISVSSAGVEHYIFLDETLLRWVREKLQKALGNGWKLGKGMVKRSGSRALLLGSFTLNNVCFLRMLEVCGNGRRFFVALPADDGRTGWSSWLRVVDNALSGDRGKDSLVVGGGRSFADVVGRGSIENHNSVLVESSIPGKTRIVIKEPGLDKRLNYLKSWVVVNFNLGSRGFVVWSEFRKWMFRWWGVKEFWESRLLGDDSWIVDCGSEEAVDKIVNKGDWFFRGANVEVRRWFPAAGRLNLLGLQGVGWVQVFGVPVHARSEDVFREIGDVCGGFIQGQNTRFSAIRLKVRLGSPVPDSITLNILGVDFELKILVEPLFPPLIMPMTASTSAQAREEDARDEVGCPSALEAAARVGSGAEEMLAGPVSFGPCFKPFNWSEIKEGGSASSSWINGPAESIDATLVKFITSKPLSVDETNSFLQRDPFFLPSQPNFGPSVFSGSSTVAGSECPREDAGNLPLGEALLPSSLFECSSDSTGDLDSDSDISFRKEDSPTFSAPDSDEAEQEAILAKGIQLAHLLDLSVNGSTVEACNKIKETSIKVFQRLAKSALISKRERELRRLKWNISETDPVSIRDSRYDSSTLHET
ncbi:hypothetical protein LINPERPRIM_LOCUS28824 [Linum perenne]